MKTTVLSLIFLTANFLLIGCLLIGNPIESLTEGSTKRYVVLGKGYSTQADNIKREVHLAGGRWHKDLKYHPGFVAFLTEQAVQLLVQKHGYSVEVDPPVYLVNGGCAPKPNPQPPPVDPPKPPPGGETIPWGLKAVDAERAWPTTKGKGVTVCVVDTGIAHDHPDLYDNLIGGESFVQGKDWSDENGHGTHVAGTIAASHNGFGVVGVAPEAKLYASRVLDENGSGFMSDVADGIMGCVHAKADIINMSLGSDQQSSAVYNAVREARAAGLVLVAAAGNNYGSVGYPAAHPEVIAISAVNDNFKLADFSSRGPEILYAGPGVDVYSTVLDGDYDTYSGTSMAAPHCAGVYALALSLGRMQVGARDLGLPPHFQGLGLCDARVTVQ